MSDGFNVQQDIGRYQAKVAALIAKANSTEYPDEAESLMAKAHELMARYGINEVPVARVAPADNWRDPAPSPPPPSGGGLVSTLHEAQAPWAVVVVAGVACGAAFGATFGSGVIQTYLAGHIPTWVFQRWEGEDDVVAIRVGVEAGVGALLGLLSAVAWRRRCRHPAALTGVTAGTLTLFVLLALFGVALLGLAAVCIVAFGIFVSKTDSRQPA